MAFWWSAYYAISGVDLAVKTLGEVFKNLPLTLDLVDIILNFKTGNVLAVEAKSILLLAKVIAAISTSDESVVVGLTSGAMLDVVGKLADTSNTSRLLKVFYSSIAINGFFEYLHEKIQPLINSISGHLNFAKAKAWANYLYYKCLYEGK